MNSITLKSRAKINLSIDVLGKRQDGYHLVEMIMQTIDLYDLIEINEKDNDQITIKSTSDEIPLDCNNLVYKAANLIKKTFNINKGVEIHIKKNIPVAAGMAGGSSNAAAVLVGLNKLWNLNLSNIKPVIPSHLYIDVQDRLLKNEQFRRANSPSALEELGKRGFKVREARASTGKLNGYYVTARSGTEYKASEIGKGYTLAHIERTQSKLKCNSMNISHGNKLTPGSGSFQR